MHKFNATASVRTDITNHRGAVNSSKSGTNFKLNGIANVEASRRLQVRATEADGFYSRQARLRAFDLRAQWGRQRNPNVSSWYHVTRSQLHCRLKWTGSLRRRGLSLQHNQGIF